jgi:hypothetical protein
MPASEAFVTGLVASSKIVVSVSIDGGAAADVLELTLPADLDAATEVTARLVASFEVPS